MGPGRSTQLPGWRRAQARNWLASQPRRPARDRRRRHPRPVAAKADKFSERSLPQKYIRLHSTFTFLLTAERRYAALEELYNIIEGKHPGHLKSGTYPVEGSTQEHRSMPDRMIQKTFVFKCPGQNRTQPMGILSTTMSHEAIGPTHASDHHTRNSTTKKAPQPLGRLRCRGTRQVSQLPKLGSGAPTSRTIRNHIAPKNRNALSPATLHSTTDR